jgi:hypothetical protein
MTSLDASGWASIAAATRKRTPHHPTNVEWRHGRPAPPNGGGSKMICKVRIESNSYMWLQCITWRMAQLTWAPV